MVLLVWYLYDSRFYFTNPEFPNARTNHDLYLVKDFQFVYFRCIKKVSLCRNYNNINIQSALQASVTHYEQFSHFIKQIKLIEFLEFFFFFENDFALETLFITLLLIFVFIDIYVQPATLISQPIHIFNETVHFRFSALFSFSRNFTRLSCK